MAAKERFAMGVSSESTGEERVFLRQGTSWIITFDGVTCRLPDACGLRALRMLLTHPHEEISALVLERSDFDAFHRPPYTPVLLHDARERARVNATAAIATALRYVALQHPGLAAHLAATITTGIFCSYRPEPAFVADWRD